MTLRVQGTISINGAQAKSEAKAVAGELRKVSGEATGMGRGARDAGSGARVLGSEARNTAAELRALAAAERQAAADAIDLGRSQSIGASGVANLTSQFNDIGVMLAAGQNPLQLAIQQGTQITQVFGNMGAGAAVRGLGQALLSMVSPLNLITIGGIAAGAALVQWLFQSGEEVKTLEDQMDELSSAVTSYSKAAREARLPSEELISTYGRMASEAKAASAAIAEAERVKSQRRVLDTAGTLSRSFGGFEGPQGDLIGSAYEQTLFRLRSELALTGAQAVSVAQKLEKLSQATGPEAVAMAALEAQAALSAAGVAADSELGVALANLARDAAQFVGALSDNGSLVDLAALIEMQAKGVREANVAAEQMIASLQAEAMIRNQIAIFGRDSELVAQSRLAVERELVAAQMEAEGIIGAMADRVLEAWDNAKGFKAESAALADILTRAHDAVVSMVAAAPGGGWLAGAIDDAARLADKLFDAAKQASALRGIQQRLAADGKISSGRGGDPRTSNQQGYGRFQYTGPALDANNEIIVRSSGSSRSGRGGAASAAREERNAVADLIEKLEREIELERELDPVKQEMIRHREALKDATAAEREQVEALIVQREREKAATESLQWVGEQSGDTLVDALMGAADAGDRLIETLKRAVLQALLLGSGPLAGLFGGGIFSSLSAAIGIGAPGMSTGGMVFGAGGPTDDKVPRWLSPGEFVVNAKATRRHRHMLEGLNSVPGMASGGLVGGGAPGPVGTGSVVIAPKIDARGSNDPAAIERAARKGMAQALDEYRRTGLPLDIRRSLDSPNVVRF